MHYEAVIGLEVHVELKTATKIFCNCTTAFGGAPNTHVCPVCLGLPGAMPVLNKNVLDFAIKAGLATNCTIAHFSKFDRKNYFYPDLTKAYQISQFDLPIAEHGHITIEVDGVKKDIGLTRIHMEEDAGKLVHQGESITSSSGSYADYNRAGVPLIEIVSEPDMRSAKEAKAYLEALKAIIAYTGVSDAKMEEGSLRCDVNISLREKGTETFGTRAEIKNLNSFKAVEKAIEHEIDRQSDLLDEGKKVKLETRTWDDAKGMTFSLRSKEEADEYRYFPEPDLPPVVLTQAYIDELQASLPRLPQARYQDMLEDGIGEVEAKIITSDKALSDFYLETKALSTDYKAIVNWLLGDILAKLNLEGKSLSEVDFAPEQLAELIELINTKVISSKIAKEVFLDAFETGKMPKAIVEEKGLVQISNTDDLYPIVQRIVDANPQSVEDYKNGKAKAIGFLVGQMMKETKGKANPSMVNDLIIKAIEEK